MDFVKIREKTAKSGGLEIYPEFIVTKTKDIMVRGKTFYAFWDSEEGLWSTDSYRVAKIVDERLSEEAAKHNPKPHIHYLSNFDSGRWKKFRDWCASLSDNSHMLDQTLAWQNTPVRREDYVSKRLPYALEEGDFSAWDEMMDVLYAPEERAKLEWAIGAIVAGDAKHIQKFMVLFGGSGTGKSTVLHIIEQLFDGYWVSFDAAAIGNSNRDFALEPFKTGPLVAIQHDGDLSKLNDNTKLNSIVAHEPMLVNEKFKPSYTSESNAFLFMGTNSAVKITDRNAGLIRRLIDVEPTGRRISMNHYNTLMGQISFQLGAIAWHCREVYWSMGKNYYEDYIPQKMMMRTNIIYNFLEAYYDVIKVQDGGSLKQLYTLYKEYCSDSNVDRVLPMYKFREEMLPYFKEFHKRAKVNGETVYSYFEGFKGMGHFKEIKEDTEVYSLVLDEKESLFDTLYKDSTAQYAKEDETPEKRWAYVKTTLADIDTRKTHYVKVPQNHIVIDFDLKGPRGGKDLERNLEAASQWPPTYAELSKSGSGVHLHYIYEGDPTLLDSHFADGIEVKVYTGNSALRRKLTRCNRIPIATMNNSLPQKEKKVLAENMVKSEKALRELVERNLNKEIHPGTKPSVDFIHKILEDAYNSDLVYDLTDMRGKILTFAGNSTNKATECVKMVQSMKFKSKDDSETLALHKPDNDSEIVFFDVEVFENLFVVCWKYRGSDTVVRMVNPSATEVEGLFNYKLVGFNNRRYDNHILYARYMGYDNQALFNLSQKIIENRRDALFGEAYNLSYTDIYDFSSKKQGLKKFGIELGLHHVEVDIPWDQPVPPEKVDQVVEYCVNDVLLTEAVFDARKGDWNARLILSELSGLSVNSTTQAHTARIVFGTDKNFKSEFVYTDLSKMFPGYVFDKGVSTYRGEVVGEGGYVYAEPGMYDNVTVLDVASMHPTSIVQLDLFGKYTNNFEELLRARVAIKHREYREASRMLGGKLKPYLEEGNAADDLAYALKIVINIVYGLTSAKFDNPFRDSRNIDNIVAKRGALFMIDLKNEVQARGFQVVHIKTDSIKIPDASQEIIEFIMDFGRSYGYEFEYEFTYDKFCLVNDAVYIATKDGLWDAVGAQFQHPYVMKTLFTKEPITMEDMYEAKSVMQGAMYLDYEHDRPLVMAEDMHFVGRTGLFVPVKQNGGMLYRVKDGKHYAVTGTKNYLWREAEALGNNTIDMSYYDHLVDDAIDTINKFGDFKEFVRPSYT